MARRALDETRRLLLETGAAMLRAGEVGLSATSVRLIDVCREAGLSTAGSGYKIWPTQEAFRTELLRYSLDSATASEGFMEAALARVHAITDDTDFREAIRVMATLNAETNIGSPSYHLYVALWCAAASDPVLAEQLRASDETGLRDKERLYEALLAARGLEWKPPFTATHLATMLSALIEGLALRARYEPDRVPGALMRPTGPDGADQPWHLFACGVDALVTAMSRPAGPPR